MNFYPAIDLKDGKCVRLFQGQAEQAEYYACDPVEQALAFEKAGAQWMHMVDLDAAFSGVSVNHKIVEDILHHISIPIQLGGGIRSLERAEKWLSLGVSRVVFGTAAIEQPDMIRQACRFFPQSVAVGIDARDGVAMSHGWVKEGGIKAIELAANIACEGLSAFIYTDIARDGTLDSPNFQEVQHFASLSAIPVIASGGVAHIAHLKAFSDMDNIIGVICGKALYTGHVALEDALDVFRKNKEGSC